MKKVLVTGGAGFVGSNIAIGLRASLPNTEVVALDNLKRRGSELNVRRLEKAGVSFHHGDVRNIEDIETIGHFDLMLECSAEPSVLSGYSGASAYLVNTNLLGTANCLEVVRKNHAAIIFFSTSRVYPIAMLKKIPYTEDHSRFRLDGQQGVPGLTESGIAENFSLEGPRSLYGATKYASEILVQEYSAAFDLPALILRCGTIAGAWQMGKVDQGVITLWVANHLWGGNLAYKGFGGSGKQVRDVLDIRDLVTLVNQIVGKVGSWRGEVFNVGGGLERSVSLFELTQICQDATGNSIPISSEPDENPVDIPLFITDSRKVGNATGWAPSLTTSETVFSIISWLAEHKSSLRGLLA